jgi:hypothetical protein
VNRILACGATCLLALPLTACAGAEDQAVDDVARTFVRESESAPGAACQLLAPQTAKNMADDGDGDCAKGLSQAGLKPSGPVQHVTVSINAAQVVMVGDTVFLAKFDSGWKVLAAGCSRTSQDDAVPYDCQVKEA